MGQMEFKFKLKRRWKQPIMVTIFAEGIEYAYETIWREYPKHKILELT